MKKKTSDNIHYSELGAIGLMESWSCIWEIWQIRKTGLNLVPNQL